MKERKNFKKKESDEEKFFRRKDPIQDFICFVLAVMVCLAKFFFGKLISEKNKKR